MKFWLFCAAVLAAWSAPPAFGANSAQPMAGKQVFDKWCLPCHGDSDQAPGTLALRVKYKGTLPAVLEQRTNLTAATVKYFVRHGVLVMPFFRKTEISDVQLNALANYLQDPRGRK